jgi:hypothetical protein
MNTIESLMEGYSPQRRRLEESKALVGKWEPTGLLEGLASDNAVNNMAVLLENQARQLIDESSKTGTASNSEEWSGVALPLVRRIFGELAAQEFVSVQPMNLPSGLIFYLDFKYGTAQAGFTTNTDIYGNTSSSGDATGGLYGAGKFGYTINDTTDTIADGSWSSASVVWEDVEFDAALSSSLSNLFKVSFGRGQTSDADWDGVRAFVISGSGLVGATATQVTAMYPAYTSVTATSASFIVDPAGSGAFSGSLTLKYHKLPTDITRGDFEQTTFTVPSPNSADDVDIPEIDIKMKSIPIVAKTRKLKAVWTPELAQDLNAYHSVDAEAELTAMLSEYITMEIDLEILDMLKVNASAKTEYWSARPAYEYNSTTKLFAESSANASAYTKGTWFQTLGNKLQSVSNAIHQKTLRGGANFIVVSPETATIIESIPGYAADTNADPMNTSFAMGVQKVGMLQNRYTVYKNPYMMDNTILMGFRGSNFLETGAVYAPYVPLIMTPLVYDPVNFTPRKGVMTRYAKKMVRPEFYGLVHVADVNYV